MVYWLLKPNWSLGTQQKALINLGFSYGILWGSTLYCAKLVKEFLHLQASKVGDTITI